VIVVFLLPSSNDELIALVAVLIGEGEVLGTLGFKFVRLEFAALNNSARGEGRGESQEDSQTSCAEGHSWIPARVGLLSVRVEL